MAAQPAAAMAALLQSRPVSGIFKSPPPLVARANQAVFVLLTGRSAQKKGGPRLHPRCARPPITSASMVASIAEKVKSHGEKIEQGQATPYAGACPRCGQNKGFGRHQIRRREFRVIVDGWVRLIPSWICRWKCKACGKTFTDCPPFDSRRRTAAIPSIRSNNSLLPI